MPGTVDVTAATDELVDVAAAAEELLRQTRHGFCGGCYTLEQCRAGVPLIALCGVRAVPVGYNLDVMLPPAFCRACERRLHLPCPRCRASRQAGTGGSVPKAAR